MVCSLLEAVELTDSPLWLALHATLAGDEWQVFFGVCDRLLVQLKPLDELITTAEEQLEHVPLLGLFDEDDQGSLFLGGFTAD
ncbi:hypothetical protein [Pseudomonas sp. IT-347P]|uniref:hypothetical protein n=1 Tax=Pseudomonas sp. IT-347P TaxID=3026458 RepID=UPI0039E1286D